MSSFAAEPIDARPSADDGAPAPVIVAAIDGRGVSATVLRVGAGLSGAVAGTLRAVHVDGWRASAARMFADEAVVPLEVLRGDPARVIVDEAKRTHVVAVVLALRSRAEAVHPVGGVARSVIERVEDSLVVVPPTVGGWESTEQVGVFVPVLGSVSERILSTLESTLAPGGARLVVGGATGSPPSTSAVVSAIVEGAAGVPKCVVALPAGALSHHRGLLRALAASAHCPVWLVPVPAT